MFDRARPRRSPWHPTSVLLGVGGASALLTGCFTTAADFGDDAENYLVNDEQLRAALLDDVDAEFTTASCVDPEDQDEGTTFTCTATDSNGRAWEFEMTITGSSEYDVSVSRFPDED